MYQIYLSLVTYLLTNTVLQVNILLRVNMLRLVSIHHLVHILHLVSILHLGILLRKVTNLLVDMFRLAMLLVLVAPLVPGIVLSLDILAFIQMCLLTSSQ